MNYQQQLRHSIHIYIITTLWATNVQNRTAVFTTDTYKAFITKCKICIKAVFLNLSGTADPLLKIISYILIKYNLD
jgi:hypothetical protein